MTSPPTEDEIRFRLASNVKRARLRAGLTQKGLAERSEVAPRYVWRWETGLVVPSFEHVSAIAAATEHEFEWFYADHTGES